MKKLAKIFGHLLALVCITLLARELYRGLDQIPPISWDLRFGLYLGVGLAAFCLTQLLAILIFLILAGKTRQPFSMLREGVIIHGISSIAKYLPGNIYHYVGRIALARNYGFQTEKVVLATFYETGLAIVTAALFGCYGLYFRAPEHVELLKQLPAGAMAYALAAAGVLFLALIAVAKVRRWLWRQWQNISLRDFFLVMSLYGLSFCILGLSLFILQRFFVTSPLVSWLDYTWGFALAWVVGFVVPGAPGGVGIREYLLMTLFASSLGSSTAATFFLIIRLLSTLADFLFYLLGSLLKRGQAKQGLEPSPKLS